MPTFPSFRVSFSKNTSTNDCCNETAFCQFFSTIRSTLVRPLSSCTFQRHSQFPYHHRHRQRATSCTVCHMCNSRSTDPRPLRLNRLPGPDDSCASSLSSVIHAQFQNIATTYRTARYRHRPEFYQSRDSFCERDVEQHEDIQIAASMEQVHTGASGINQPYQSDHRDARYNPPSCVPSNPVFWIGGDTQNHGTQLCSPLRFSLYDPQTNVFPSEFTPSPALSASLSSLPNRRIHNMKAFETIRASFTGNRFNIRDNKPQVYTSSVLYYPQTAHSASSLPPAEELYLLRHIIRAMKNGEALSSSRMDTKTEVDNIFNDISPNCSTPNLERSSLSSASVCVRSLTNDCLTMHSRAVSFSMRNENHLPLHVKRSLYGACRKRAVQRTQLDEFSRRVMHLALESSSTTKSKRKSLLSMPTTVNRSNRRRHRALRLHRRRLNFEDASRIRITS